MSKNCPKFMAEAWAKKAERAKLPILAAEAALRAAQCATEAAWRMQSAVKASGGKWDEVAAATASEEWAVTASADAAAAAASAARASAAVANACRVMARR